MGRESHELQMLEATASLEEERLQMRSESNVNVDVLVIGHGIGGKDIPIIVRLAKARRWSKR